MVNSTGQLYTIYIRWKGQVCYISSNSCKTNYSNCRNRYGMEAAATISLLLISGGDIGEIFLLMNLLLLIAIWLSTALIQLPLHNRLNIAANAKTINNLIISN